MSPTKRYYTLIIIILGLLAFTPIYAQYSNSFKKAKHFIQLHELDSADFYLKKCLKHQDNNTLKKALLYVNYSKLLKLKEQTDSSFVFLQKALNIYQQQSHQDSIIYTNIALAELFRYRNIPEKASYYIDIAAELLPKTSTPDILAYYYNRKAAIQALFFDGDRTVYYSQKVIDLEQLVSNKEIILYSYNELGYQYEKTNPKKSLLYYQKALKIANDHQYILPKIDILILLSRIDDNLHRAHYLEMAYNLANTIGNKDKQFSITYDLHQVFAALGDYQKAHFYSEKALQLLVKLYDSRILVETATIERKYNLNKAQNELSLKLNEMESAKKQLLFYAVLTFFGLILLVVAIYFLLKSKKDNRKLERLSEENAFLLSEANHRINNNLQLIIILLNDQIRSMDDNAKRSLQMLLTKIESIATLHRHLYESTDKNTINGGTYIEDILSYFTELFKEKSIQTEYDIEHIMISNDQAIYFGLLVTELCINTVKHAFSDQNENQINISFKAKHSRIHFSYADNGDRMRDQIIEPKLIRKLCKQLKVDAIIDTKEGFSLHFTL